MIIKPILKFAHSILEEALLPGNVAVDCTMGNGHDTLLLARLTGQAGHVYAFDIQQDALNNTQKLLSQHGISEEQVTLICGSHADLGGFVPRGVKAAVFNLGYLPGGDKSICTAAGSTIAATEALLSLMEDGGVIVLVVYRGHEQGAVEAEALLAYCEKLDGVMVVEYKVLNNTNKPPFVIIIEKKPN